MNIGGKDGESQQLHDPTSVADRLATPAPFSLTPTPEDLEEMLKQMAAGLCRFACDAGMSPESIKRIMADAAMEPFSYQASIVRNGRFSVFVQISEILNAWHSDPSFLDDAGQPRALPIAGDGSFAQLANGYCPGMDPADLAQRLVEEQVLVRTGSHLLKPRRRTVSFGSFNSLMLDRIPVLQRAMLTTVAHNLKPATRALGTHCERGTTIEDFPTAKVDAFKHFVKDQAQLLADKVDNFGNQVKALHSPTDLNRTRVGVAIFSYEDAATPGTEEP